MHPDYHYSEQSRRPITIAAFVLSTVMFATGVAYGAPWYFLAPVVLSGGMTVIMIARNRKSGMELLGATLHFYSGKYNETVPLSDIAEMQVTRWTESAPTIALLLQNNKKLLIPGQCCGSAKDLSDALASRSIPIRQT